MMIWLLLKISSLFGDLFYDFFVEIFGARLEKIFPTKIKSSILSRRKSVYKKNLRKIVNEMPFLYKDLKVEVLNDFANVEIQKIALNTLQFEEKPHSKSNVNEKLRESKRVLFLGNAGIGKTTFQRYSILTLLNSRKNIDFLYPAENPFPFYIPLKGVDDSQSYPILNYILNIRSLFPDDKRKALKKLIKIVKKQQIFLFIDGYDEMQFLGGDHNFIRDELNLIMKSAYFTPDTKVPSEPTEKHFYDSLPNCRVWVSSRREFFRHHPFEIEKTFDSRKTNIYAVALKGLYENRFQLIKNIFSKYPKHYKLLDAKYFIREIGKSDDPGMIELSYNPLFLTIMCYVYVRKVIDKQDYKVKSAKNYYDLITECVDLLLIDLDKGKVLGTTEPERDAELNLRNAYLDEKREFLPFFAVELFADAKSVFDLNYINKKVLRFFEIHDKSTQKEEIIKELKKISTVSIIFLFN